jgi:hypothetical protein
MPLSFILVSLRRPASARGIVRTMKKFFFIRTLCSLQAIIPCRQRSVATAASSAIISAELAMLAVPRNSKNLNKDMNHYLRSVQLLALCAADKSYHNFPLAWSTTKRRGDSKTSARTATTIYHFWWYREGEERNSIDRCKGFLDFRCY